MRLVCKEDMCSGCKACIDTCSKNAIHIVDDLKAYNAVIDENKCINCNACIRVCPNNGTVSTLKPILWKQGWCQTLSRGNSSSGGVAAAILSSFLNYGGIVCSCVFRKGKFGFEFSDSSEDIEKFLGSKYVKSDPEGIYKSIKNVLLSHRKVLFLGLPCQVAALKNFVGDGYESNLFTIDLICHGTPSPEVLERFLNEYDHSLKNINWISFRKKNDFFVSNDLLSSTSKGPQDWYTIAFLKGLDYTNNCYYCQYAKVERVGDLSLGDSWGSKLSEEEQNNGISLILCQTSKGEELIKNADLHLESVDRERATRNNQQLCHPSVAPVQRDLFFDQLLKGKSFKHIMQVCYPKMYLKKIVKGVLMKCKVYKC